MLAVQMQGPDLSEAWVEGDPTARRRPAAAHAAAATGSSVLEVEPGCRHEVRNAGAGPLRFIALYASDDVTTTYVAEVQPDGGHERQSTPS